MRQAMSDTIQHLGEILGYSVDSTQERVSIYFKTSPGDYAEHDRFMGITVPVLRKISKRFMTISLEELGFLIQSQTNEERLLTLIILAAKYKAGALSQKEEIYQFYRTNMSHINNWNLVDASAHLIIGAHLCDKDRSSLLNLATSEILWERRISIVSTLYFIRKNDLAWTFKIASLLLRDTHDLIHKAVGWMLREAGKKDEARLISFLCDHVHQMPKPCLDMLWKGCLKSRKSRSKPRQYKLCHSYVLSANTRKICNYCFGIFRDS